MEAMIFQKKKAKLISQVLLHNKEFSIGKLEAQGNGYVEEIDNFLILKTEAGALNLYLNGANPMTNTDEDYLKYDQFGLYSLYTNISLSFESRTLKYRISDIRLCFTKDGVELLGTSIKLDQKYLNILFSTDEIKMIEAAEDDFEEILKVNFSHFSEADIEFISTKNLVQSEDVGFE
jgi:hypothetical protein